MLARILILLTFVSFIVPHASMAMTCEALFSSARDEVRPSPFTLSPLDQADNALANRIRSMQAKHPKLWPDLPLTELRPFISEMASELDLINRRLIRAKTPWAVRQTMLLRVQHMKLSVKSASITPTYRRAVDLGFHFQSVISTVETLRGYNEFRDQSVLETALVTLFNKQALIPSLVDVVITQSKLTGAVLLPTFAKLPVPRLNRLWSQRKFPLAFTGRTRRYDGVRGSFQFTKHDINHVNQLLGSNAGIYFDTFGAGYNGRPSFKVVEQLRADLESSEKIEQPILSELDRYAMEDFVPHPTLKVRRTEIEDAFFEIRHESSLIPTSRRFDDELSRQVPRKNEPSLPAVQWLTEKWMEQGLDLPKSREALSLR